MLRPWATIRDPFLRGFVKGFVIGNGYGVLPVLFFVWLVVR